ncbi:Cupin 2 conserved barrel domain protein [Desulfarculus baarsii DSM 2075]|uniref:Cupin 2 conserved barrel domain protein n=1 Tax=Desulfarculus baarsii (strain ATCC 33931 / DSM 2075 / LMG 7858 / VKM B-1802 / 2st14) TaxID=644282 RepID=E1QMD6_DESB2|nr:cupin domain-containing protein [Desulfarculus baarsii]ADK86179.1 Cupin 2 conserved barrel domain protein [Desulfarculus baarsii DSM 2075]
MKHVALFTEGKFRPEAMSKLLVHDSPHFKIINFNFEPGQELPVHSHDIEGQLSIVILEGQGEFLAKDGVLPAAAGDVLISDIAEPHGLRAKTRLRALVTIAPPI